VLVEDAASQAPDAGSALYSHSCAVRPRASSTVVEAAAPWGGVTVERSPPYTVAVRHCSTPYASKIDAVWRAAPS
jgi:hypothetical protein